MVDGASSVEREQLKIDLDIINKEIAVNICSLKVIIDCIFSFL